MPGWNHALWLVQKTRAGLERMCSLQTLNRLQKEATSYARPPPPFPTLPTQVPPSLLRLASDYPHWPIFNRPVRLNYSRRGGIYRNAGRNTCSTAHLLGISDLNQFEFLWAADWKNLFQFSTVLKLWQSFFIVIYVPGIYFYLICQSTTGSVSGVLFVAEVAKLGCKI